MDKYAVKVLPNFDHRQAVYVTGKTPAILVQNLASIVVARGWRDICSGDWNEEDPAQVEMTYVECYRNFEIAEGSLEPSYHIDDFAKAATVFAALVVEVDYFIDTKPYTQGLE